MPLNMRVPVGIRWEGAPQWQKRISNILKANAEIGVCQHQQYFMKTINWEINVCIILTSIKYC